MITEEPFSITDHAVATTVCPYCGSKPGRGCKTVTSSAGIKKGLPTLTHAARRNPLEIAFGQGYQEALTDEAIRRRFA